MAKNLRQPCSLTTARKTLIIGQAPAKDTVGKLPFSGKSGPKFADLLGVEHSSLWDAFDVVNLIEYFPGSSERGDVFPMAEARRRVVVIRTGGLPERVVLVGKNVARAFGLHKPMPTPFGPYRHVLKFFEWYDDPDDERTDDQYPPRFCVVPHPSGVSHFWNDPANVRTAKEFMSTIPR